MTLLGPDNNIPESGSTLPIPIAMYEVSGHGQITEREIRRFEEHTRWASEILNFITGFNSTAEDQQFALLTAALNSSNPNLQLKAIERILHLPQDNRPELSAKAQEIIFNLSNDDLLKLITPPLYNKVDESFKGEGIHREDFRKSGSETVLL